MQTMLPAFAAIGQVFLALLLGAAIGFERQLRQRMAGLRTNALVALGSSAFVVIASLTVADTSPTRMAAQVVSGIGFLCAGCLRMTLKARTAPIFGPH
jgi:putative Mg2+ transporter-C (MgtC) family protein